MAPREKRATQSGEYGCLPRLTCHHLTTASPTPCNAPQIRKLMLKPCHNPPSTIVNAKLMYCITCDRCPGRAKYR